MSAHDPNATRLARRRVVEVAITELASRQHGVVTRAQLRAAGLRPDAIDQRVAEGRLLRLYLGVYGVGMLLPERAPIMAAALACGGHAVVSHGSAAALYGLCPVADDGCVDVSVPLPFDRTRAGVRVHRVARLLADERAMFDHIPVTSPARTLADLATRLEERDLERAIARAEREGMLRSDDLDTMRQRYSRRPGAARLLRVIGRAGGPRFTRSEAEARFLGLVRRAGLPAPQTNAHLGGFEIDFLWPDYNLAVEVDGFRYHASRASFESDRRRSARLASLGVQVVPLTWRQIVDEEIATIAQVAQALALRR
ncbi:MAG TPA: type IV toxin-antitoxin system AbiEi family antitoxin domain-containing protein [Longimicrobiales bacterium]